jgi:multisubunit Na+/H+ antiporter MnhF subunit
MMAIDEFGGYSPFYKTRLSLDITDRVIIMDTIGSMFSYFQILVLLLENKLLNENYFMLLLAVVFLHVVSILNYLKNQATNKNDKHIIPDLFKVVLIGCFLIN